MIKRKKLDTKKVKLIDRDGKLAADLRGAAELHVRFIVSWEGAGRLLKAVCFFLDRLKIRCRYFIRFGPEGLKRTEVRYEEDLTTIDEIIGRGVNLHIERMSDQGIWMSIDDGVECRHVWIVSLNGRAHVKMDITSTEDSAMPPASLHDMSAEEQERQFMNMKNSAKHML